MNPYIAKDTFTQNSSQAREKICSTFLAYFFSVGFPKILLCLSGNHQGGLNNDMSKIYS
jgi:hypothetical protein